jgi:phosphoribosylformylglycinamidine synthase
VLQLPVAHGEGAFYADAGTLARLEESDQIVFRYCDHEGSGSDFANFNGSVDAIAGVCNEAGNVVGLMPHPERACDPLVGGGDGLAVFQSALAAVAASV